VWRALGSLLSTETRDISQEYQAEAFKIEAIDLITFCLRDLHQTHGTESANESSNHRDHVSVAEQDAPSKIVEQFSAMLVPIICGLLSATEKLTNSMQNLEFALPALELIQEILKPLKEND
jgi:hypothetical protein